MLQYTKENTLYFLTRKLPSEIIEQHVEPYARNKISPRLNNDIRSFSSTYVQLIRLYNASYNGMEVDDIYGWIENDILQYLSVRQPPIYNGDHEKLQLYERSFRYRNTSLDTINAILLRKDQEELIGNADLTLTFDELVQNQISTIRVLWGLMTSKERLDAILFFTNNIEI